MYKKILLFFFLVSTFSYISANKIIENDSIAEVKEDLPVIAYSLTANDKKYTIADIKVTGVENYNYEEYVLVGISGLSVGDKVSVPGNELTTALNAFRKYGLFSWVRIEASKLTTDSVWLEIALEPNPIISEIQYHGVKKGEREDLESQIGMTRGSQVTPNLINQAKRRTQNYFDGKGFGNADVRIQQRADVTGEGRVILDIIVDKNEKTKVKNIYFSGNENISDYELKVAMKKTNEGFSLKKRPRLSIRKLFSTKKFVKEEYETDLENIIQKYNERGYRDAYIVSDSVVSADEKRVDIYLTIHEGNKFHIRSINWVGNTLYQSDFLDRVLDLETGDVYNQKKLTQRLMTDEDAVWNLYTNNGYIFSDIEPVEMSIENDSIDIEVRIQERNQATINRIGINGNDRLYEDIVRRELVTKPGQLFSKELVMMSAREIAQMGHFDAESMDIQTIPNQETGTVDLNYNLTPKASDQIEFSAGYGQTGVIGKLSLRFSNFSMANLLNPDSYKGFIPQGEGQTLTLSGQTNGRYYQSYSVSFMDPWFGGKRPNNFSASAYYMVQTGVDSRSYSNYSYNPYYSNYYDYAYDDNQYIKILGLSVGYGKRLRWPDPYFSLMADVQYQRYWLKNWSYFPVNTGNANSLAFGLTLSRSSIDNPIFPRSGSTFSFSVNATPPYSLWDGVDYASMERSNSSMYQWIEYHKWKFKGRLYLPLANKDVIRKTPVLMSRIEYGFLGNYTSKKYNPFETFYVGGDGMSGYSTIYANEMVGLRGYESGSLTPNQDGYAYSRMVLELRYPLMLGQTTIYLLSFVEAGNAWSEIKAFNPFDLKRSAGVGARVTLPMVGLIGLDWAYGFDSPYPGYGRSAGHMHFVLGQEF